MIENCPYCHPNSVGQHEFDCPMYKPHIFAPLPEEIRPLHMCAICIEKDKQIRQLEDMIKLLVDAGIEKSARIAKLELERDAKSKLRRKNET